MVLGKLAEMSGAVEEAELSSGIVQISNATLLLVVLLVAAAEYGALPLLIGPNLPAAIALILLVSITTPLHWGLLHESFHGVLSDTSSPNKILGRVLAIPLGMSWDLLRFGHLNHHDSNRHLLDRPEVLPQGASWIMGAAAYYPKLLGGHASLSTLSTLLAWLPMRSTAWMIDRISGDEELKKFNAGALRNLSNPERRVRIRVDSLLSIVLIVAALYVWGRFWPVFVAMFALRYAILSLLDNAHHYGTVLDSGTEARNTWLPGWAKLLVLHQNFHGVHHARPELRWRELEDAFNRSGKRFNGTWYGCVLRQFGGPVRTADLTSASGGR